MFATANPSVGGFDVSVSAIFIRSREIMNRSIRGVLAPVVTPLKLVRCPRSLAPTRVALPSMSLIPSAPFKADLSPDSQRYIAHCKWLLSQICGLAVFGTNSKTELAVFKLRGYRPGRCRFDADS